MARTIPLNWFFRTSRGIYSLSHSAISRTQVLDHPATPAEPAVVPIWAQAVAKAHCPPVAVFVHLGSVTGGRSAKARCDRGGEERFGGPPAGRHVSANRWSEWLPGPTGESRQLRRAAPVPAVAGSTPVAGNVSSARNLPYEPFRQNGDPVEPWTRAMQPGLWPLRSQWVAG